MTMTDSSTATRVSVSEETLDRLARELGPDAVVREAQQFADPYRPPAETGHEPTGAVFPTSTEQVQAVLRIARETGAALWTSSMGHNYGYGGGEARLPGSIALSLSRMDRVLDIDDEHGVAVIEPGVTFFALSEALRAGGHRFTVSVPDLGWGSVLGNALDHGVGYSGAGEHTEQLCGMEVVLASGDVLRTGTGGLTGTPTFHLRHRGFGPSLDGLFGQSNLGVVTSAGIWLAPEAESFVAARVGVSREADVHAMIEVFRPLMLDGTITSLPIIGHAFGRIAASLPREQWAHLSGAGTEEELAPLLAASGQPIWNARFGLTGRHRIVQAQMSVIEEAFATIPGAKVTFSEYEPPYTVDTVPPESQVPAGVPNLGLLRVLGPWDGTGGDAGHLDLSPAIPLTGDAVWETYQLIASRLRPLGVPSASAVLLRQRSALLVNMLMFDRTDTAAVATTTTVYRQLLHELADRGYGLYRTHIDDADDLAGRYDFGDHALARTLRTIKDALDPQGILSPGKQGVWPTARPRPQAS